MGGGCQSLELRDSRGICTFPTASSSVRGSLAEGQLGDGLIEDGLDLEADLLRGWRVLVLALVTLRAL